VFFSIGGVVVVHFFMKGLQILFVLSVFVSLWVVFEFFFSLSMFGTNRKASFSP
jgi:hypothetical protein